MPTPSKLAIYAETCLHLIVCRLLIRSEKLKSELANGVVHNGPLSPPQIDWVKRISWIWMVSVRKAISASQQLNGDREKGPWTTGTKPLQFP